MQRDPQYRQFFETDPDLQSLRSLPKFVALLGKTSPPGPGPSS